MTTIREHHRFGQRYLLISALSVIPFVAILILVWMRIAAGMWDGWTWAGLGVFAFGAIFGLWFQHRRSTRFVCLECGRIIVAATHKLPSRSPIEFYCEHCDIKWKTGLRVPEE